MITRSGSPAQPTSTTSAQPDPDDLAELDALADALNQLGFPALRLTPPGKLPYVDTGLPKGMTPGERIYAAAGMYFWPERSGTGVFHSQSVCRNGDAV